MIKVNGKEVLFERFPNGETKMLHETIEFNTQLRNNVHFKYETDEDLIKLMFVKGFLDKVSSLSALTIYYMPYSRMDRSIEGGAFTLKYVAELINNLNFHHVWVVEPHSEVTTNLLDFCTPLFINFKLIEDVKADINFNLANDCLFFPDAGAQERYEEMTGYNQLIGFKKRNLTTGVIESLEVVGDVPEGARKAIIVDDLSSYGGTFVHSAIKLKQLGFKEIYLLVAHAENNIFKGELFRHVNKVFATDSILSNANSIRFARGRRQLKVYSLEDILT